MHNQETINEIRRKSDIVDVVSEFIFITDFPTLKRPFYHHRNAKGLT